MTNDKKIESRRITDTDTSMPDTHDDTTGLKGKKAQMDDNIGLDSNPAVTQPAPETSQDTADPEDGVSYASISYTKKTNSKARVPRKDEGDAVTYSTVKASSSSAGASTDPSNLYATVN
ncbi:uncharacterized protein LOC121882147 isoform X1 [Scomber scombrus]|uniref:Uncharacterized protein LOC121882147 isoform X1 n=1 Tax=Scomber scombrus TaxID=13677 RepID=A0AAV1Q2P1_SCOSC